LELKERRLIQNQIGEERVDVHDQGCWGLWVDGVNGLSPCAKPSGERPINSLGLGCLSLSRLFRCEGEHVVLRRNEHGAFEIAR
jgi:hypothetical protein